MQNRRRASVRSQLFLVGVIAMVGAGLPALPAAAADEPTPPTPKAAAGPAATTAGTAVPTDQFIVKFKERAGIQSADRQSSLNRVAGAAGVSVENLRATASGADVVKADRKLGADEANEFVAALAADPNVEYAEPDVIMRVQEVRPNDTYFGIQWGLGDSYAGGIHTPTAWDINQGEGSVVAVVDSGILSHTDLNANVLPGYDMIGDPAVSRDGDGRDSNPRDEGDATTAGQCAAGEPAERSSWHGTHVAGIIAAVAGNGKGIAGVAPKAKVVPVRSIGTCGGYLSDIAEGIAWAAGGTVNGIPDNQNPARVINVSIGAQGTCPRAFQNAVDFATELGASVVVSAGNQNVDASLVSPANCRGVVAVGASTKANRKAYYSNFGAAVDLMAPGGDMSVDVFDGIVSTLNNGTDRATTEDYYLKAGTSMAAPHVAGVAAMMLSILPAMTPADVEQKLKGTAGPLTCVDCGNGLLNADRALRDIQAEAAPIVAGTPTIYGELSVGNPIWGDPGSWGIAAATNWELQWHRNGVAIPEATGYEYLLVPEDLGAALTFTVKASKKFVPAVSATSAPTAAIKPGTLSSSVPTIKGSTYVGNVLTVDPGNWGPEPVSLSYQWYRSGSMIQGATGTSYSVVDADAAKPLTVQVTGAKQGYTNSFKTSAATQPVVTADKAVTPAAVVFADALNVADDKYTIPQSLGTEYQVGGSTVPAGTYPARGQTRVTAKIKDGYVSANGAVTEWAAYFSFKGAAFTAPAVSPFKDVLTKQQFYKEMAWMADRKISTGWVEADKSVTYRPLAPINRDAMAAFLYRMAGSPAYTPPAKSPFKDVTTTQQFYKEMSWLAQTGISSGWTESDGSRTYRPLTPINRDAMAAFLYRLANQPDYAAPPVSPFQDVQTYQLFYKEMAWLSEMKISSGWTDAYGGRTYQPLSPINRDAMAAFLYRMP
ncbi:S8 family serine peptidase [Paenarthrobacter aurescens]|uniref:S8 family serine peptidase n=1 Tax=Paenarthrobacter aurescens TaxID=43663 RepID=UPI0021C09668|nr:S8 family serine peptidase [Paenarthrobacter aurescens]MCT9869176.1 S8 family serine peptidase [Paenarthrobacter aurescens]